jgi:hypothetical protein
MAINLANVNVSIHQFQAVASGEVNAGEVKLTSETTLGKVNNFVTRKWKNKTDHTHKEVLAVKSAFIRALNSCGVVGDELARVRAKLGLAPEQGNGVDRTLGERGQPHPAGGGTRTRNQGEVSAPKGRPHAQGSCGRASEGP